MSDSFIDKVNQSTNIVELVGEFVQLEKRGKNYMGLCPFHDEKTPSFSVSPEKNIAVCMSCKKGGAPLTFYSQIKNISFKDALNELAARAGLEDVSTLKKVDPNEVYYQMMEAVALFYHYNLLNSESGLEVLDYLEQRHITHDSIKHFQVGLSPKYGDTIYQFLKDKGFKTSDMIKLGLVKQNDQGTYYDLFSKRLMFPIKNVFGRVVAFSGRTLDKDDHVKYVNSPETPIFSKSDTIYHYDEARNGLNKNQAIIVSEGFFDCIKIYQSGFNHVVATMGTALTKSHVNLLLKLSNQIITAFDGDQAGLDATYKAAQIFLSRQIVISVLPFPSKTDPDEYIDEYGDDAFLELVEQRKIDAYTFMYRYIKRKYDLNSLVDKPKFKKEALKMLGTIDPVVAVKLKEMLAKDLDISKDTLKIDDVSKNVLEPNEKRSINKLSNRHENAEIEIIASMTRSKELAYYIDERLEYHDYINTICPSLRGKIVHYYETYEVFDFSAPELELNEDEHHFLLNQVFGSMHYQNSLIQTKESLIGLIDLVKDGKLIREFEQGFHEKRQATTEKERLEIAFRQDELRLKLSKQKGD